MARYFKGLFESCFIHFQKPFAKHFLLIFLPDHVWLPFEDQSSTAFCLTTKLYITSTLVMSWLKSRAIYFTLQYSIVKDSNADLTVGN